MDMQDTQERVHITPEALTRLRSWEGRSVRLDDINADRFLLQGRSPDLRSELLTVHGQPSADGKTVQLWARDHEGWLTMQATAKLL